MARKPIRNLLRIPRGYRSAEAAGFVAQLDDLTALLARDLRGLTPRQLQWQPGPGRNSIGMILGLSSMIMVIGQIGGPLIAGAFADWLGNYRAGFTLIAALAAVGSLFFWMAKRPA